MMKIKLRNIPEAPSPIQKIMKIKFKYFSVIPYRENREDKIKITTPRVQSSFKTRFQTWLNLVSSQFKNMI